MRNSNKKPTKTLIGAAGVHFVVSELSLRGLVALPTIRNTAGIDILVSEPDGSGQVSLQVKARSSKEDYWPTSRPERCLKGPGSFYVFVRYLPAEERFEAFLESGSNVAKQAQENLLDEQKRGLKDFPYWRLPLEEEKKTSEKVEGLETAFDLVLPRRVV
jgi:hypothetical protein